MVLSKSINQGEFMTEAEAISYVWDTIFDWKKSETWALRYSCIVLASVSSASGVFVNSHYRNKLRIGRYGYLASALPIIVLPGTLTMIFHKHMISTSMIMADNICPLCYEIKSATMQLGFGLVYPMILGPISAFMLANRYGTYRMPSIVEQRKEAFKLLIKISKPLKNKLLSIAIGQLVLSSFLTYFELQNTASIRLALDRIETNSEDLIDSF